MEKKALVRVDRLTVAFNREKILDGINFTLFSGDTIAVVGPNGAGKTVLLRALLGLVPYEGKIEFAKEARIGYVPQKLAIERDMPLTVGEFLRLRTKNKKSMSRVLQEVDPFHSGDWASASDHNVEAFLRRGLGILSGGQFQKVLITWALLNEPNVLLFDEPTTGLDMGGEETVYAMLRRLQHERKLAILLVSHDLTVVYRYADQVMCLNRRAICLGPPKDVLDPKTLKELYGQDTSFYEHTHET